MFNLVASDNGTDARAGEVVTSRGIITTPIFMPVGTLGTVKGITPDELLSVNSQIILGNTYHLYLRPGMEVMNEYGGLHNFMKWDLPILTDSGGYQVFSLAKLRQLTDEGVTFRNHLNGDKFFFTPELSLDIQKVIGSDIAMILDECPPADCDYNYAKKSLTLTHKWAKRAKKWVDENRKNNDNTNFKQFYFGIVQGAVYTDLREDSIKYLSDLDFDGYAIGGLSVGEPEEEIFRISKHTAPLMPKNKARYAMGLGKPHQLLEMISHGVDMFDCVMPTRVARTGTAFTYDGKMNLRNEKWKKSNLPIDENCQCKACKRGFSRGYIRHLIMCNEILGIRLISEHNLFFYIDLMKNARDAIVKGDFINYKNLTIKRLLSNKHRI